jgi:hypothetical protein
MLSVCLRAQHRSDLFGRPIGRFTAQQVSRIDALTKLAKEQQLPLGIEYAGPKLFETVNVRFGPTSLGRIIEYLFPRKDGFRISAHDGVLLISHTKVPGRHVNLLDARLPELAIPESTVQEASLLVQMVLARQLQPNNQGWAGSYNPGTGKVRVAPLKLSQVTVREALNRIVSQHGRAAWIVQVQPELLTQMQPGGLWMIVEYDSLPTLFGGILRKRVVPRSGAESRP